MVRLFLTVPCGLVRVYRTTPHRLILPLTEPHRTAPQRRIVNNTNPHRTTPGHSKTLHPHWTAPLALECPKPSNFLRWAYGAVRFSRSFTEPHLTA